MKLLWFGDLAATGFGTVTSDTGVELVRLGVDVRFVSQNEFALLPEPFLSRTLNMPTYEYGQDYLGVADFVPSLILGNSVDLTLANGEPWGDWKPDAVFLLGDFYGMREMVEKVGIAAFGLVPTFHYCPVEGHELPSTWNDIWRVIKPIAMTKFGQAEIAKIVGYEPPMAYHGVDTATFRPVTPTEPLVVTEIDDTGKERTFALSSKAACKAYLGIRPEVTLVLRTDRLMPRKGYPSLLRAMAPVMRARPNVALALNCRVYDQGGDLTEWTSKYPDIQARIWTRPPEQGPLPRPALVAMYNAADLYVSTSAEGFGLTIAESLACGTPAVGIDYSAVPEVIGPAGLVVPVGQLIDNQYGHYWAFPDEEKFSKSVAYLLDHPHKRLEMGRQGPGHVAKNFRWDLAAAQFMDIASKALRPDVSARELVAA